MEIITADLKVTINPNPSKKAVETAWSQVKAAFAQQNDFRQANGMERLGFPESGSIDFPDWDSRLMFQQIAHSQSVPSGHTLLTLQNITTGAIFAVWAVD